MNFIPAAFAGIIVIIALIKRTPVFELFTTGAREGVLALWKIAPTIVGLVFAVSLLKNSGAADALCSFFSPAARFFGFPEEIVPMALLRPVSGSGSSALLVQVFEQCGPDSFAGRVASVIAGSSETTFYATAMYFGSIGVKKIRHTLAAALAADFTAMVMSVVFVRIFYGA